MTHTMTLEVPEEVYLPLLRSAEKSRKKPEDLAVYWLSHIVRQTQDDPIEKFIGAIASDVPNWADEHDRYLGKALAKDLGAAKQAGEN